MFIDVFGSDQSGILPLQHFQYDKPQGGLEGWDLDLRAHKRCVRIVGRWDTGGGIGQWKIDRDSVGDLCGGYCWPSAGEQLRKISYWSFAIPAVIVKTGSKGTPTPGGGGGGASQAGQMVMLPQGDQAGSPDGRLAPTPLQARVIVGKGPKKPPAAGGKGDLLLVGMGTSFMQWNTRPFAPGEQGIGVGIGSSPIPWDIPPIQPGEQAVQVGAGAPAIGWQPPRVDPAANPNVRPANPAIGALRPKGK